MTKYEILQHLVNSHNRLVQIRVSGDDAIMMGETLKEMRFLVRELKNEMDEEQKEDAGGAEA